MYIKKNILLGINWEQNSTAALMINGQIVGCSSEERFSRIKNDERYPKNAIDWLIKTFDIKNEQIDNVCFISNNWTPSYSLVRHYTNFSIDDYIEEQKKIWYPKLYKNKKNISILKIFKHKLDLKQFPGKSFWKSKIKKFFGKNDHTSNLKNIDLGKRIREETVKIHLGIEANKVRFIDHSSGHIFYSYFASKKNSSTLAISLDAFGDFVNYKAVTIRKFGQKIYLRTIVNGSNFIIGRLYRYVTLILGLKPNEHEYKVMGMAPYSKKIYFREILSSFFKLQDIKNLKFKNISKFRDLYFHTKKVLDGKRFDTISGGLQAYTEQLTNKWIKNLLKETKIYDLCLAGGVAMNVKNNLCISEISKIKNVFVPPSPDDSSQAMGACYVQYYQDNFQKNSVLPKPISSAYLGYNIENHNVEKILKKINKKQFKVIKKNINMVAAKLIQKKKVVARCVGRAEFGARSLGNRSILSHPGDPDIKKIINDKIKNRDFWMPFAATILDKYAKKYFDLRGNIENYFYMTNCVNTKKKYINKLSAAIHPYDYTCRPQILTMETNGEYYDLINKFGNITKTYALLNTSFNLHGFPLVNNESDAIKVFKKTKLDALILGKYLIIKKSHF